MSNRKAKKLVKHLWVELDLGEIVLLGAAFALILIPLTIASKQADGWKGADIIAMLCVGGICFLMFPFWEKIQKLAPRPLILMNLFNTWTFCVGCGIGSFYFMAFYLSVQPCFYSHLLVVQHKSVPAASHITQTVSFTSTVASIIVSFFIKYTKYYKPYVVAGVCIYIMGLRLMIKYRISAGSLAGSLAGTQIAVGIGGGMLNVPAQLVVQASTDHQHVAVATAVYLTCMELGCAVGSAISGVVWGRHIPSKLTLYLPEASKINATAIYNDISVATSYALGTPERAAINRAYQETIHILLIVAICVTGLLFFFSLFMSNYKLDEMKQNVKGRVICGALKEGQEVEVMRVMEGNGKMEIGK